MSMVQVAPRHPSPSSSSSSSVLRPLSLRSSQGLLRRSTVTTSDLTTTRTAILKQTPQLYGGTTSRVMSTLGSRHELFKPWGVKRIEANGDYRQDAWLEKHIGGPLYQHQDSLPRLPVPNVQDTLKRFLPTALPLCENELERKTLTDAVANFANQAETFQKALLARAASPEWENSSWLQYWWNTWGYLQVRDTVVINVSYFFDFADDPSAARPLQRGAALLTAVAQFRQKICSGQRPADMVGRGDRAKPLDSTAFKYLFHACRIPALQEDTYRFYDPSLHHHAIVARKGFFFKIDFCDPISGKPYPLPLLEQALQTVLDKADQLESQHGQVPKLGWLTTQNRDDWAKARAALLEYGGTDMERALEDLESGAFLLCLDEAAPVSRQETASLYLHGGMASAQNRWFDKSVQVVLCQNGKAGFIGEHSMMDGMPVIPLADHLTKQTYDKCLANAEVAVRSVPLSVEPIFKSSLFPAMVKASGLVEEAKRTHAEWTGKHELHCQTFHGYGSNFIKESGYSPDAFVQMAMQIATFRLWGGRQVGTYESTQVRPFLHGRTETTRSVSSQSAALCQIMGIRPKYDEADSAVREEKLRKLEQACQAHVDYIGLAAQAQGVDRHFLGLSMIGGEVLKNQKLPDLYSHPVFQRSKRWRVSTSHLTHPRFENWGYGEVVPDGVGLSYSIHPRHIVFNCTALREHAWTDKLSQLLQEALLELRRTIEANTPPQPMKSKL